MMKKSSAIGSSFDSFLEEETILAQTEAIATKIVFAYQMQEAIKAMKLTKTDMAKRMNTSRAAINRLLDPDNTSITLASMESAAFAVGKKVKIEFV